MDSTQSATNIKVSVLSVTNRPGGIDIFASNLRKQTFKDFEWILIDGLFHEREAEVRDYCYDLPLVHLPEPPAKNPQLTSVPFNLGLAYNYGISQCKGEYILSLQDYLWIPGDGIEKMLDLADGKTCVIGVGHKGMYPNERWKFGGVTVFNEPFTSRPTGISEVDDRLTGERDIQETNYSQFELNYTLAPKQMFYDVGGFEESFDNTWYGADNTAVGFKASLLGYKFILDKTNECVGFNQALFPRPHDWEQRHNNKGNYNAWARKAAAGDWTRYL